MSTVARRLPSEAKSRSVTARHAPVADVDLAEVADQHVGGLQVAMDDAALVGVGHAFRGALHEREHAREGPLALAGRRVQLLDDVLQRALAGDQLHREVELALGRQADLVDGRDARVIELSRDLGLLQQARGPGVEARRPALAPPFPLTSSFMASTRRRSRSKTRSTRPMPPSRIVPRRR